MRTILSLSMLLLILMFPAKSCGKYNHMFHLDHRDGLSNNYIRSIGQDNHGFVWVATIDGLNRFDGKEFKAYKKENSGLSSNELNSLLPDPVNPDVLWISTRHDGLCKFDYATGLITPEGFNLHSADIPYLSLSSDNKIWVTHYHFTPDKFNPATGEIERIYNSVPEGMPRNFWCAVEDPHHPLLYIGHDGGGLTIVDLKTKEFRNLRHSDDDSSTIGGNHVYSIHIADDGSLWLGTENGVSIFDKTNGTFENITSHSGESSLMPGSVVTICPSRNGDLWFGTNRGGVSILSATNISKKNYQFININDTPHSGYPNEVSHHIQDIFEDSYGNKWIGTLNEGVNIVAHNMPFFIQNEPFEIGSKTYGHQAVWSIATDRDGNLWIGGEDEIVRINDTSRTTFRLPLSADKYNTIIRALYFDTNGTLWIGTSNDGAYTFSPSTSIFSKVGIPEKEIRAFLEMNPGHMLVGTSNGVYSNKNNGMYQKAGDINKHILDNFVTSLLKDKKGNLWVGTFGKGVTKITPDGKSETFMSGIGNFPSFTVNDLMEDSNGNVWAATRGGIVKIPAADDAGMIVIDHNSGLSNSDVKSIEEDSEENIWMSVNDGIALYNPTSGNISTYHNTYRHHLHSFAEASSCTDKRGNIYFGSLNGISIFNPSASSDTPENDVKIFSIIANDKKADDQNIQIEIPINSETIKLPYNLNTFSIKFCNPDITETANSDFCYNMEGVNEVWTDDKGSNEAVYRDLRPGTYRFRVRQRVNGGEWGDPLTLATIVITPPLYLTWWAKSLYVCAAVLLIVSFLYFYKHKLDLEKNLEIERQKSKNDQKINEERMAFFTNITHELRTPLTLIVGPIEDLVNDSDMNPDHRKKLLTIRTSSMRLLNLINGILEFRKTETSNKRLEVTYGNFPNYIREIGLRFKELNNNPDVNISIYVSEMDGMEMYFDPDMIAMILNNLFGNAMKYTKSGRIELSLTPVEEKGVKYVDIKVSDTGEGISPESLPHIFERYYQAKHNRKVSGTGIGLALTKNLVDLHEGTISVESEPGKGSVFTVRLLVDNSYPNALHKEVENKSDNINIAEQESSSDNNEKLSLLIVEDDNDVRDYIMQSFGENFKVYTASDGREGFDKALEVMPDIIVSDIMMPEMDGIELCSKIKSDSAVSHIPVILLTAKDTLPDKEQGYTAGADSYITKPFSAKLLRARINNILENRLKLTMRMLETDIQAQLGNNNSQEASVKEIHQEQNPEVELTPFDRKFIAKFKMLTEENIEMEDLDIAFFTDKMCMSHSTLYRKVKSITGFTPNEFIRKIKLHKAAEMLMTGKVAISEIPFRTGFNSSAYFRRVFKKEFGVSPTDYINKTTLNIDNTSF